MKIPRDFTHVVSNWATVPVLANSFSILPVEHSFDMEAKKSPSDEKKPVKEVVVEGSLALVSEGEAETSAPSSPAIQPSVALSSTEHQQHHEHQETDGVVNCKIMAFSGRGSRSIYNKLDEKLVFLTGKKKDQSNILACIGGPLSRSLDGPATSDVSLWKAAVRHYKEQTGIDLSFCTEYIKFVEIHYSRPVSRSSQHQILRSEAKEVTVIFVPAIIDREKIAPGPQEDHVVRSAPVLLKNTILTLKSMLDYNENDADESTFEVSLFSELFRDCLRRDFGLVILRTLEQYNHKRQREAAGLFDHDEHRKKQKVDHPEDGSPEQLVSVESSTPSAHLSAESDAEVHDAIPAEGLCPATDSAESIVSSDPADEVQPHKASSATAAPSSPEERSHDVVSLPVEEKKKKKNELEESAHNSAVNQKKWLLRSFEYFDPRERLYLKSEDLENLLLSLGANLCKRQVEDLVDRVIDAETNTIPYSRLIQSKKL